MNKENKFIIGKNLKVAKLLCYLLFVSLILSISTRFFINLAGTFTPGIAGVAQGITYTLWNVISSGRDTALGMSYSQFVNNFYLIINWSLNIPIIIFSFRKVGLKFSLYSLYVMLCTIVLSIILTNVPGIKDVFDGTKLQQLKSSTDSRDLLLQYTIFPLIGLFGGITYGYGCGLIFKVGYSTMGFDPVAKYLEVNKSVNINKTLFTFSMISSVFWIIVCAITSGQISNFETFITYTILSPTMATTLVFIGTYGLISNLTYPSTKKKQLEITSKENELILFNLKRDYPNELISLNSMKDSNGIESEHLSMVVDYNKYKNIVDNVFSVDEEANIVISNIDSILVKSKNYPK